MQLVSAPSRERYADSARIEKLGSPEHDRVEQLVAKLERSVRRAFLSFVQNVQSPAIMRQVAELLGSNDVEGALRIVDRYVARMAPVFTEAFTQAGRFEADNLDEQLQRVTPLTGISFDPTYPRAAEMMRANQLNFIQGFTDAQRQAVREALSDAMLTGRGPIDAAREFRGAIGLTGNQVATVRNYRRLLTEGSREALSRDLRDRRFDSTVRRAATTGDPLSTSQIDTMVDRYRQRMLMSRAETIACTETGSVVSAAREEAFKQTQDAVGIDDTMVERIWRSTKDKRTRDSHRSMDMQTVEGTTAAFVSGHGNRLMRPHDPDAPASETINCRCVQLIRIKRKPE